jgi:hypothetical protein
VQRAQPPLLASLKKWFEETLVKLSKKSNTTQAVRYALGRWEITYASFRTFEETWVWLVKQRPEEGPRGWAMEPTNQGEVPQEGAKLSQVIQIDEGKIQAHLGEVVRSTVEETLNAMLDAEADRLCRAERYERADARQDTRAGSYQRKSHTKVGEVSLKVPKLRTLPFETAIIERYRRRESSVEEALVEMYLAGVSVRRVEDITEAS